MVLDDEPVMALCAGETYVPEALADDIALAVNDAPEESDWQVLAVTAGYPDAIAQMRYPCSKHLSVMQHVSEF